MHTPKKAFESRPESYLPIPFKMGEKWTNWHRTAFTPNHQDHHPPPKWPPLKFLGCWQSEASVWRSFLKAPPPFPPPAVFSLHCVRARVCKLQFSGFIRLHWCLDSRKRGTNRTEWCRNGQKAPFGVLEAHFLSPSLLRSHSVSITHPSISLPLLFYFLFSRRSFLHQHRSAFTASAVKRRRCCSTNFSHPFYSCHSTISQKHFESAGGSFQPLITPTQ